MPRKVKYGLDYDDGYDNYDDYDYNHEVKGDGYDEDSKCHLFHYFRSLFQAVQSSIFFSYFTTMLQFASNYLPYINFLLQIFLVWFTYYYLEQMWRLSLVRMPASMESGYAQFAHMTMKKLHFVVTFVELFKFILPIMANKKVHQCFQLNRIVYASN